MITAYCTTTFAHLEMSPLVLHIIRISWAMHCRQLIHTSGLLVCAGRMQDNEPLMRALSNLINLNEPDLTLFVGEALVGNDAVDQLTKFNQRLADLAKKPDAQMIQGLVLTKMDTIDDKVQTCCSCSCSDHGIPFLAPQLAYSSVHAVLEVNQACTAALSSISVVAMIRCWFVIKALPLSSSLGNACQVRTCAELLAAVTRQVITAKPCQHVASCTRTAELLMHPFLQCARCLFCP